VFTLLFIGMVVALTASWLLIKRLQAKPWTQRGILPASQDDFTSSAPQVGLWAFLGVVTSLFLVFTGAYFMRMDSSHGGVAMGVMQAWTPLAEPRVLWGNTVLLVLASITFQLAHSRAGKVDIDGVKKYFNAAGVLTIAFLFGQLFAWQQLIATGDYTAENPAFTFFVLLTAVHGLHLVGGLVVWARTATRLSRGLDTASVVQVASIRQSVQLCTTYWHYLLLVWLALFVLLLST